MFRFDPLRREQAHDHDNLDFEAGHNGFGWAGWEPADGGDVKLVFR